MHLWISCFDRDLFIHCFIAGNKASVPELVDFIFAAQIAKKMNKEEADEDEITCYVREKEV